MKLSMNIILTAALAVQLASCTTTGNGEKNDLETTDIFAAPADRVVVQKMGKKELVISPYGRSHWLKARDSKDATIQAIQGMLATSESLGAERMARKYLAKHPGNVEGLTALSSALAMSGQYDLAAYYAKLVTKKLPENPHSLNIQGLAALMGAKRIEEYKRAESLFQRSFDSSNSEIAAGLNLGNLYLELGNTQSALEIFQTTDKRCSSCIPALMGYGTAARRLGKNEEALIAFNKLLDQKEDHAPALYHRALLYRDGFNNQKKAVESLKILIKSNAIASAQKRQAHALLRSIRATLPRNQAIASEGSKKSGSLLSLEDDEEKNGEDNNKINPEKDTADTNLDPIKDQIAEIPEGDNIVDEGKDDFQIAKEKLTNEGQSSDLTEEDGNFDTISPIDPTANKKNSLDAEDTINAEFDTQSESDDSF